jgi:hypothetical protein
MSHVAKIEVEIKDLEALRSAAASLGLELVDRQTTYRWYGRRVGDTKLPDGFTAAELGTCEHALRVVGEPSAYEIGIVARRDGGAGYTLLWDSWNGGYGLVEKVGAGAALLKQAYGVAVATRVALRAGYRVVGTMTRADGNVELKLQN